MDQLAAKILGWTDATFGSFVAAILYSLIKRIFGDIKAYEARQQKSQEQIDKRDSAVDNATHAANAEDAFKAQEDILNNEP